MHQEVCALAWLRLDADPPAHQFDQLSGDRQPKSGAAVAARRRNVRLGERGKQSLASGRVDSNAVVANRELDFGGVVRLTDEAGPHNDAARVVQPARELDGVANEVDEYLSQPCAVAQQTGRDGRIAEDRQPCLFAFGQTIEQGAALFDGFADRHRLTLDLQPPGLDLREIQNIVDDLQQ